MAARKNTATTKVTTEQVVGGQSDATSEKPATGGLGAENMPDTATRELAEVTPTDPMLAAALAKLDAAEGQLAVAGGRIEELEGQLTAANERGDGLAADLAAAVLRADVAEANFRDATEKLTALEERTAPLADALAAANERAENFNALAEDRDALKTELHKTLAELDHYKLNAPRSAQPSSIPTTIDRLGTVDSLKFD